MSISSGGWPACGLAVGAAASATSATALRAALGREHHDLRLMGRRSKVFSDSQSRNPDDFPTTFHNGNARPFFARNLVVGENVLKRLRPVEPCRAHAIALAPGADRQRRFERAPRQKSITPRGEETPPPPPGHTPPSRPPPPPPAPPP